jgi:hypothetical protein
MPLDHLVPEFYLKFFGNEIGQVSIKTIEGLKKVNARSALVTENFYSNVMEEIDFEANLQITESQVAPIMKKIVSKDQRVLSELDYSKLFEFICSAYLRSYRSRNLTANMIEIMLRTEFVEVKHRLSGHISIKHREGLDRNDIVVGDFQHSDPMNKVDSQMKNLHFQSYKMVLSRVKKEVQNYELHIIEFTRKRLITCDSPTVLFSDSGQVSSLVNAEQIYFPLSPRLALFYTRRESNSSMKEWFASTVLQELFNDSIVRNARYGLVSHPDDYALIGTKEINSNVEELEISRVIDQINRSGNSETQ